MYGVTHGDFHENNVARGRQGLVIFDFSHGRLNHSCPAGKPCLELQRAKEKLKLNAADLETLADFDRSYILSTIMSFPRWSVPPTSFLFFRRSIFPVIAALVVFAAIAMQILRHFSSPLHRIIDGIVLMIALVMPGVCEQYTAQE